MKTLYLPANDPETPAVAANILKNGGLVALPTETVYGLGANGLDEEAVAKIFEAKGRPGDNPLILHVAQPKDMERFCHSIPREAYLLAEKFWPGPLTIVLPARDNVPKRTTGGLPTVAIRCPATEVTRQIIELAGVPVAAPSANISGKPSTTTAEHVFHDHDGRIEAIVDGGPCSVGVESTIVDLTDHPPRLLRPGGITPEQLYEVLGEFVIDKAVTAAVDKDEVVKAPGMKYRHYAPDCRVLIVDGDRFAAQQYIRHHWQPGNRVLCFEEELELFRDLAPLAYGREADTSTLLAGLFAALRQLDDPAVGTVFARCPRGSGQALAVQNRLEKAAGFCRVNPREKHCVIGVTGGSGSGKTTLLNCIRESGGTVIDCDEVYHRLLEHDTDLLNSIAARFPGTVEDGSLDRKKLGAIVFADKAALQDLNAITHTAVKREVLKMIPPTPKLVAIDAIALFEGGLAELCDVTVAVTAPVEDRVQRLMARDNITEEYARSRIAAQREDAWFREKCQHTLSNDSDRQTFREKCLQFLASVV
jgi:L-threonylcarbamoyladenylate synthase